jgi:hypothetical protein
VPALWTHCHQWHQLRGLLRGRLRLLTIISTALSLGAAVLPASAEGYGRWQTEPQSCQLQRAPSRLGLPCGELRLEQNLEGLLSVRFIALGKGDLISSEHLLFAGVLEARQPPMRCRRDGRCEPQWPTSLVVATVADARFDARGLAQGLPRTHLARGRCQLERRHVRCEAVSQTGERWQGEAEL